LIEDETRELAAASERDRCANGPGPVGRLQGAQVANEIGGFRVAQACERRHAGGRQPLSKERRQLLVGPRGHARRNAWSELAAVPVAPVAAGASADKDLTARIGRGLGRGN